MTSHAPRVRSTPLLACWLAALACPVPLDAQAPSSPAAPRDASSSTPTSDAQTAPQPGSPAPPQPARETSTQEEPLAREARERVRRGMALLQRKDYDGALAEFQRAHELLRGHPKRYRILFNIALAHERRQRYDLAIDYYRRYLREGGPGAEDRERVEATLQTLEGFLGTLRIETNVRAEVWVDDRRLGEAPGTVRIPGGPHTVELRATGHESAKQRVQLAPQQTLSLRFELVPLAETYRGLPRVYFWSGTALTGALALTGAILGARTLSLRGALQDRLDDPRGRLLVTSADHEELAAAARTADLFFLGAALAAAGTGVLALLTDWGDAPARPEQGERPELSFRGAPAAAVADLSSSLEAAW